MSWSIQKNSSALVKNIASVGVVQIANYIIPIIIMPFVVRALGASPFGVVSYAQNIISYLTIIVYFGFEYSATQDVAIYQNDKKSLCTIFWTVIFSRLALFVASMLILIFVGIFVDKVNTNPALYFNAALVNFGIALFPTWFFQGLENMGRMALFNFLIKFVGAVLIVIFVRCPNDYQAYVLILSCSYIFVGFIAFVYVIMHYDLKYTRINITDILVKKVLKKSFPIFINNLFMSAYTLVGMTILGYYESDYKVGIYSGAYRIIMAVMSITSLPINIALFPIMSRLFNESVEKGARYLKRILKLVSLLGILMTFILFFVSPLVVHILLGNGFNDSIPLLRLFSILPFLVIVASMLTIQGLYGLQLQYFAPYLGAFVALVCIVMNLVFIPKLGIMGAGISWIVAQLCEIVVCFSIIRYEMKKMQIRW
jgi:polysaccharide transporter, PST family